MTEIQINRESLLALLQKLIQIDSVNPSLSSKGTGEASIARYIGAYLNKLGLEVRFQEIEKNRVNVIGVLKGTGIIWKRIHSQPRKKGAKSMAEAPWT
jgi:acetylornithine deacetylase